MSEFVQSIADSMNGALGAALAVFLLSMIPIAEARFAIPFGMSMGLSPMAAFGWAFLGTAMITPILLLVLIPIINALAKTKLFSRIGKFLYAKFEKKSHALDDDTDKPDKPDSAGGSGKKSPVTADELKRMGGTAAFVAVPIPLTGVWTGSAVASITGLGFIKGLISIVAGNAVACLIITLMCRLFAPYVNYITLAFFFIALTVLIVMLTKLALFKPKADEANTQAQNAGGANNNISDGAGADTGADTPDNNSEV